LFSFSSSILLKLLGIWAFVIEDMRFVVEVRLVVSFPRVSVRRSVIRRECGQTWTRVRVWTSIYCSDNY